MYALDLFTVTGASSTIDTLYAPEIGIRGWSKRINAPGKLVFSMNKYHPSATDENLRMWRHVRLYRRPRDGTDTMAAVWYGIILGKREIGDRIEVVCEGALKLFEKRYTGASESFTGQGSTEAFGLLTDANSAGATGITEGTGGVTDTCNITLDAVTTIRAWEEIAAATGGEFEIDDDAAFNFVPSLGSDKSATVELVFRRDGEPGGNVLSLEIAEDGTPMANKIVGTSSGGGGFTYTFTHPTSTPTYPVLIEHKTFNHANDQGTLDALTEAYGNQRAFPIPDFQAVPVTEIRRFNPITGQRTVSGFAYGDVDVGDLVTLTVITDNRNISVVKRVAEIIVDVDDRLNERVRLTFTEAGVFVTENYLGDTTFRDIKERIQIIEGQL